MPTILRFWVTIVLAALILAACSDRGARNEEFETALNDGTVSETEEDLIESVNATQISIGSTHSCALRQDGNVYCWGGNHNGEVGNGSHGGIGSTIPMPVLNINNAIQVSSGFDYSCALLSEGIIKCWGGNYNGQLGDGNFNVEAQPVPVKVVEIDNAIQVDTGVGHTCALLSDKTVKCWGQMAFGEVVALGIDLGGSASATPVTVSGVSNVVQISTAHSHNCAVIADGSVKCWGTNQDGQLGDGTTNDSHIPVQVSGVTNATKLYTTGNVSCALLSDQTIKCWGFNDRGQLGIGNTTTQLTPVTVDNIDNAIDIADGGQIADPHICAVLSSKSAKCWGVGRYSQLGTGQVNDQLKPITVPDLYNVAKITVGDFHTCAALTDGEVYCWGFGGSGALGISDTDDQIAPTKVIIYK